ncbi:MAG: hypothetical protein NVS1B4_02490 [Gemmatimonadaceae bacterium]
MGSAPRRILDAVIRCAASGGVGCISLQGVAREGGVSKGLVLYHFRDKATLLAATITWVTRRATDRQACALDRVAPAETLDALWFWVADEIRREDLRVLTELTHAKGKAIRVASEESERLRRKTAEGTVRQVFSALNLRPRVPTSLIAGVVLAFIDGLAAVYRATDDTDMARARPAFDVLWLALLGLAD